MKDNVEIIETEDQKEEKELLKVLELLVADAGARKVLTDLWLVMHAWDDAVDGDNNPRASEAWRKAAVDLPNNPLYFQMSIPFQVKQAYLKWEAANHFESEKTELHKAYMLRAAYYDIVLMVIDATEGTEAAKEKAAVVYSLYGETFKEYRSEICHP